MKCASLVIIAVACTAFANAQEKKPAPTPRPKAAKAPAKPAPLSDEQAVRAMGDAFVQAFNSGDAKALGALWTSDADYVDEHGQTYHGRAAIEKEYTTLFNEHPGATIKIEITSVRLLGPAAAMEDGTSALSVNGQRISQGRYSAVHVKQEGRWLISAVRDMPGPESADGGFMDLDFFVGDWTAQRDETTVRTSCKWAVGKKFLLRTYVVTEQNKDQPERSGLQIIGWDPATRQIRSWTFDSTGGHGQGLWSKTDEGWSIESEGVLADGTPTASTDLIERVDGRIIGWQSVNRTAGGQQLPDTEQVVLERADAGS